MCVRHCDSIYPGRGGGSINWQSKRKNFHNVDRHNFSSAKQLSARRTGIVCSVLDIADTFFLIFSLLRTLNDGFLPPFLFFIFYIYFFLFFFTTEGLIDQREGLRARTQGAVASERAAFQSWWVDLIYLSIYLLSRGTFVCAKRSCPPSTPQEIGSQGGVYDLSPVPRSRRYRI